MVAITSPDNGTEPACAAQEALVRVCMCLLEAGSLGSLLPAVSVLRLLVPGPQVLPSTLLCPGRAGQRNPPTSEQRLLHDAPCATEQARALGGKSTV